MYSIELKFGMHIIGHRRTNPTFFFIANEHFANKNHQLQETLNSCFGSRPFVALFRSEKTVAIFISDGIC